MPLSLIYSSSREEWIHLCVSGPFCYWTLSENTSKHGDRISQSAFFSKVRVVPKLTKKPTAQQFFFLFFQGVSLFWCPQQCMVNLFLCVVAACINKTSLESLSPTFQSASNGNRQWECLAAAAHISQLLPPSSPCSRNYYGTALTPWSPPGKIWMISHSVCKGCVYHEVTLQWPLPCCWAPPNVQHSSLLCRKERAHLFFSFLITFCV